MLGMTRPSKCAAAGTKTFLSLPAGSPRRERRRRLQRCHAQPAFGAAPHSGKARLGAAAGPRAVPTTVERTEAGVEQRGGEPSAAPLPPPPPADERYVRVDPRYQQFLDNWDRGFMETREEPEGYFLELVQGAVPPDIVGTLFRNGPGSFAVGGEPLLHPYDGDALVLSLAFDGSGRVFFRSRFVRTAEFLAERREGRILFRGTFATQRAGGAAANALDLHVKNTSNTNVVHWGGRLWSLFEAGQPYRLDPASLDTLGLDTLGGRFRPGLPFDMGAAANAALGALVRGTHARVGTARLMPGELLGAGGDAVTAHPHVDPATGRLVTFTYKVVPSVRSPPLPPYLGTRLTFYELDEAFGVAGRVEFDLGGFAFLHDFAMTPSYYVVFQNPVTVDNVPYMLGRLPAAACVRWVEGKPTLVHLIPRPGKTDAEGRPLQPRTFELPPLFVFHHANAFESADGRSISVDSIHYDSLPAVGREALAEQQVDPDVAFRSRLRRIELDMDSGAVRVATHLRQYLEMPAINEQRWGQPHRYVYGYNSVFDEGNVQIGIAKVDTQAGVTSVWRPGYQKFALEPRFVARPGATEEDDGWLLTTMFDSGTLDCHLVILSARHPEQGPVAMLKFREPVPSSLHGCWTDTCYGP